MFNYELLDPGILVRRGNHIDTLLTEMHLVVSVVHDGEHGFTDSWEHCSLGLAVLAGEETDPNLCFRLLKVVEWTNKVGQQLDGLDSLHKD
jgi:hypothetical protein